MDRFKKLQIEILDKQFRSYHIVERPINGWIKTIRKQLCIPLAILAKRLKITPQALSRLELGEVAETISLKSLRKVAESMNCRLHYILVPENASLEQIIYQRAYTKALDIVSKVDKSMTLENQQVSDEYKVRSVEHFAKELADNPNSELWHD